MNAPLNCTPWLEHFARNRTQRPEPDWTAPITLPPEVITPLRRSLEQFQLGDGGGPAALIAHNAERFRSRTPATRALVDAWFTEEREHSRLLGCAVKRFGGRPITGHWSFTAFCTSRRVLGVAFELQVLLLTEIVSTAYYRVMHRHGQDAAVRGMCALILRDEAGHIAFHRDRLAAAGRTLGGGSGWIWAGQFWLLGHAAATMLWVNHRPALVALGGSRGEFFQEVRRELFRFLSVLDAPGEVRALPSALLMTSH